MLPVFLEVPSGEQDSPPTTQEGLPREQDRSPILQETMPAEEDMPPTLQDMQQLRLEI